LEIELSGFKQKTNSMNTKDSSFSLQRIGLLIKWQFTDKQFRTIQLFTWIVLFVSFYISGMLFNSSSKGSFIDPANTLLLFGFMFASNQMTFFGRQPLLASNYLLIPVSTIEKTVTAFVLSSVYYFVIIITTYVAGHLSVFVVSQLTVGNHAPINWDFLSIQGEKVHSGFYKEAAFISIWSLSGKIFFIQAFAILSQFLVKKNLIRTAILIPLTLIVFFLFINPESFSYFKSIFDNSNVDLQETTPGFITIVKSTTTYMYLIVAAIIWRINYTILRDKQL